MKLGSDPEFVLGRDGVFCAACNWFDRYRPRQEREPDDYVCGGCLNREPSDRSCYNFPCDDCYPIITLEDGSEDPDGTRDYDARAECPFYRNEEDCEGYDPTDDSCRFYPCDSCYGDDEYDGDTDWCQTEWGTDGASSTAEMRPKPGSSWREASDNLCSLVESVLEELRTTNYKLYAGAYRFNCPLGGHIHFSGTDYNYETLSKLDEYLSHPLNNLCGGQTDRRLSTGYGRDSAYEEKSHYDKWFEYRTPPSWVFSREVVEAVYCLSWALVHDAFPTSPDTFRVWREIAQEYECPPLEKLARYAESGLTFPACDVGELWSVPIEEWADKPKLEPRETAAPDNSGVSYDGSGHMLAEICNGVECSRPLRVFGWAQTRGADFITLHGFPDSQIDAVRDYLRFEPGVRVEVERIGTGNCSIGMSWNLRNDRIVLMRGVVSLCADLLSNS